ncbi:MAG: FAD:protein FMN transferase [Nitrospiria bacterium]
MDRREVLKRMSLTVLGTLLVKPTNLFAAVESGSGSDLGLFRQSRVMMGGIPVSMTVAAERKKDADRALKAAFAEIEDLERLWSIYRPDSEISRLNAAAGRKPVTVSSQTRRLIEEGMHVHSLTEGGFNMALGPAIALWNVMDAPRIPSKGELNRIRPLMRADSVQLDKTSEQVFLSKKGMKIDPGGIGKGLISERAKVILKGHGMQGGLIAAAGDIVVFGKKPNGTPWRVGIQHPRRKNKLLASLDVSDMSVSTSGDYERYFIKKGVRYHHILDPKALAPAWTSRSVTILSPSGRHADALGTGLFVLGPERGMSILKKEGLEGVIIDADGRLHASPKLKARVKFHL